MGGVPIADSASRSVILAEAEGGDPEERRQTTLAFPLNINRGRSVKKATADAALDCPEQAER